MTFWNHRGATLCNKHGSPWNFSIFRDLSASAISSGSDKCHLEGLSSDLSKNARIPGRRLFRAAAKKSQLTIPKSQNLLNKFPLLAAHEYYHDGF